MMTNPAQPEFGFTETAFSKGKEPSREEIAWFMGRLQGHGWLTAAQVLKDAGVDVTDQAKRRLRQIASASDGRIISGPGTPGYRVTTECTAEEFDQAMRSLRSQEDEMRRRRVALQRVFYRTVNGGVAA